jgi:hypothetical protein
LTLACMYARMPLEYIMMPVVLPRRERRRIF